MKTVEFELRRDHIVCDHSARAVACDHGMIPLSPAMLPAETQI